MKVNFHFSHLIGFLNKNLTLGSESKFSLLSLNRFFKIYN